MTPLVELRDVRVLVGGRAILDVPSLRLAAGEAVAVLGRNGAGKSTLLRVVCALQRHQGAVLLRGLRAEPKLLRRVTASVLQRPILRRGTVRTNVETGLRFHGVDRATRRATGERWMAQLGIDHLAGLPAHALSGGEAQRTSLARALAVQPELLLLDEPLTGLDAPTRADLLVDLREVLARTQTAALVVTHDLDEAVALADRLLLLDAGRIRQEGLTQDVVDRPADRVCAELLGYENVIDGRLAARLLGRPGHVALRARDCTPEPATQRDPRPGDLLLAGRLVRVLPHLERLTVVADIDGTTLRTGSQAPTPAWLRTTRPGEPLGVRVRREALRPLHAP